MSFLGDPTMAHRITDSCVACGACAAECPTEAIKEGDPIYTIDAETCIDCGACVSACPSEAIVAE
jgi:ferredoxin